MSVATAAPPRAATVGVIIAARDAADYVGEAVSSVLAQTHRDLALVVVDDGSTDDTSTILAAFDDPRLTVIRTDGVGRSAARNRALDALDTPWIAILDADDRMTPDRLATQVAFLEAHPEVTVVGSAVTLIDARGRPVGRIDPPGSPTAIERAMRRSNCVVHPSTMIRGDALRRLGGYRTAFPAAQDYDLWLRLLDDGARLQNLDAPLTHYRVHDDAVSFAGKPRQLRYARLARRASEARRAGEPEPLGDAAAIDAADDATTGRCEVHTTLAGLALDAGRRLDAIRHASRALLARPWSLTTWGVLAFACAPRAALTAWRARMRRVRRRA